MIIAGAAASAVITQPPDPILSVIPDIMTYVNTDDLTGGQGASAPLLADRVDPINHLYVTGPGGVGTNPVIETGTFSGHKTLIFTASSRLRSQYAPLYGQLIGTDIPVSCFVYFKPTGSFSSSSNMMSWQNGASSPRIGWGNASGNSSGTIMTRLGSPTSNGQVSFTKTLDIWQSWCWTFDGSTVTFYRDKTPIGSVGVASSLASTLNEVNLGSNGFTGTSGEYYTWIAVKRAINQSEVDYIHDTIIDMLS